MTWQLSAVMGFALASCGGAGRAVPTEVEIEWPDAAPPAAAKAAVKSSDIADAGIATAADGQPPANAPGSSPSE